MRSALVNGLLVGAGGFLGAATRYGLGALIHRNPSLATFPYGTLAANLIGCFAIGLLAGLADSRQLFTPEMRSFAFVGVLGGLTTFSTFGFETFAMARDGDHIRAILNIAANLLLGLTLVWIAYGITSSR